ncbi:MAG TPA: aminotransferase class IV [Flavobacterium sp.]|jgi:branched-chain amino acid aminotransferase
MLNFNGILHDHTEDSLHNNRAFLYGDGVFDTLKIVNDTILFLEDHYFRLMASMRIVRMEIPMNFTIEFFEKEILNLAKANVCNDSARVRFTVYRNTGGYYLPEHNTVSYVITASKLENRAYQIADAPYEVELYKDFYVSKQLLSTIKTTNKMIHITGSIFANENGYSNCLLINENKNIVEALQGNLFMFTGKELVTPPVTEGCLNGIMRKQVLALARKIEDIEVVERPVSPFDLQKADELFITNVITGIQPITKYRKKEYDQVLANDLLIRLNRLINQIR